MNSSCSFDLFIFAAVVIFLKCLHPTGAATCHPDDEAGLLAFKSGLTQDPSGMFSSWKKSTDCCLWRNVGCQSGSHSRVISVSIYGDYDEPQSFLSGTISPSLAKLKYLEEFSLTNLRNITGSFPHFLLQFPKLKSISVGNNRLSGPLPANIGVLRHLQVFNADGNRFTGSIPSSLSRISSLSIFNLGGNLLTGTIPLEFAYLKKMVFLNLQDNHLSGTIPNIFKSMSSLEDLRLSRNKLTGKLPPSISSLPPNLTSFELSKNKLSGPIPSYLSRFKTLRKLDLSWNQFSGVVPKSFVKLTNTAYIDLSHNLLTGPLPLLNVKYLETLDLSYNKFHLNTIPKWLTTAPFIYSLKLAKCGIEMSLDDWKPKQKAIYHEIDLSENQISGSPVRFLKEQNIMNVFVASGNKLRFDMGKLSFSSALKTLDLSRNLVFGKVPAAVAGLQSLNLSRNHLCGKLPVTNFPIKTFAGNDCLCGSPLAPCKL